MYPDLIPGSLGPHESAPPQNIIIIDSAVFAGLTVMTIVVVTSSKMSFKFQFPPGHLQLNSFEWDGLTSCGTPKVI